MTLWIVLLNSIVFTPVITAYVTSLITDTSKRTSRKRFFYACVVNNVGFVGIVIALSAVMFFGGSGDIINYDVYAQPDWAPMPEIYKADLKASNRLEVADGLAAEPLSIGAFPMISEPMIADEPMPVSTDVSSEGASTSKVADFAGDAMYYPYPSYYVPDWIKAVVACLLLAMIFFFEFHTTNVMFEWFATTPLTAV